MGIAEREQAAALQTGARPKRTAGTAGLRGSGDEKNDGWGIQKGAGPWRAPVGDGARALQAALQRWFEEGGGTLHGVQPEFVDNAGGVGVSGVLRVLPYSAGRGGGGGGGGDGESDGDGDGNDSGDGDGGGGQGRTGSGAIGPGQVVVRVPLRLVMCQLTQRLINDHHDNGATAMRGHNNCLRKMFAKDQMWGLAVMLLHQSPLGNRSRWWPFVRVLQVTDAAAGGSGSAAGGSTKGDGSRVTGRGDARCTECWMQGCDVLAH